MYVIIQFEKGIRYFDISVRASFWSRIPWLNLPQRKALISEKKIKRRREKHNEEEVCREESQRQKEKKQSQQVEGNWALCGLVLED